MTLKRVLPIAFLVAVIAVFAPAQRITYLGQQQAFDLAPAPGPSGCFNLTATDSILSFVQGPGTPGAIPQINVGDVACNQVLDTTWVTDGSTLTEYYRGPYGYITARSYGFGGYANPLNGNLILGMGCHSATGKLWITFAAPPAALPNGAQFLLSLTPAPFGSPLPPTFGTVVLLPLPAQVMALDVDYDPWTATLFIAASDGLVYQVTPGGALVSVMAPPYLSAGLPGPLPPLGGIAVETTSPTPTTLYVERQGLGGAAYGVRCLANGALAPPTFWFPFPFSSGPNLSSSSAYGIAFNARPLLFGSGTPAIDSLGQGTNANPSITMMYGAPNGPAGAVAYLLMSPTAVCPAWIPSPALFLQINVNYFDPGYVQFMTFTLPGTAGVDAGASFMTFTMPPPGIFPPGTFVFLQWVVVTGSGAFLNTQGMLSTYSWV